MPTTQTQIGIANQALALIGVSPVGDITATDSAAAIQALLHWDECLAEVGRTHAWNCLLKAVNLSPEAQDPIGPITPIPASTPWAPGTAYAVGDYVTFGDPAYLYQCLIANTATASFTNDLTAGYWFQTDIFNPDPFANCGSGYLYASGWAYKYPLPEDCLLVAELNGQRLTGYEQEYQILGSALYTNWSQAIIKYVWPDPDTTRYDSLFVRCLIFKLASMLATSLRQDDTNISQAMEARYLRALSAARVKDAGERVPRRFIPQQNSNLIGSRYWSTNG